MDYLPLVLATIMLAFLGVQLFPLLRARLVRGKPAPDLAGLVDSAHLSRPQLLFYFSSPRCVMCRPMTPIIGRLVEERDDVILVDVSETLELARRFGVMGTPTLVLVRDGKVDRMLVGAKSEKQIRALLGG